MNDYEISEAMRKYVREGYAPTSYAAQLLDALEAAEATADLLAARLDKVSEVLAKHRDWKAGRTLHAAVGRAVRWRPESPIRGGDES